MTDWLEASHPWGRSLGAIREEDAQRRVEVDKRIDKVNAELHKQQRQTPQPRRVYRQWDGSWTETPTTGRIGIGRYEASVILAELDESKREQSWAALQLLRRKREQGTDGNPQQLRRR